MIALLALIGMGLDLLGACSWLTIFLAGAEVHFALCFGQFSIASFSSPSIPLRWTGGSHWSEAQGSG